MGPVLTLLFKAHLTLALISRIQLSKSLSSVNRRTWVSCTKILQSEFELKIKLFLYFTTSFFNECLR
jgi:hypothetical protein